MKRECDGAEEAKLHTDDGLKDEAFSFADTCIEEDKIRLIHPQSLFPLSHSS